MFCFIHGIHYNEQDGPCPICEHEADMQDESHLLTEQEVLAREMEADAIERQEMIEGKDMHFSAGVTGKAERAYYDDKPPF